MNKTLFRMVMALALVVGATAVAEDNKSGSSTTPFELPIRLKDNDKFIDTGSAWGHSSPCVTDVDGDGLDDLVVGDFGGMFNIYRNTGTAKSPTYVQAGAIQAGGVTAEVRIYCCIGAQARFCDLDGDGIRDLIANSYDPGHCYHFRGLPDHKFAAREELLDKSNTPIRSTPIQKQIYQSFGSFFAPVDWDHDGDFDLLIGCFDGSLKLRINEGTSKKPEFAINNIVVETNGEPLKVKAHFCPVVADWDDDGLWDIVAGSDDGSVTWFRNTGNKVSPAFSAGHELVAPNSGSGHNLIYWSDEDIVPGIRSQVEVTDYNRDGKLDLLVGDFYTAYDVKSDLSDKQQQEVKGLIAESGAMGKAREKLEALRKDFTARYPGDEAFSEEADKQWQKEYLALKESPEAKQMEANEKDFVKTLRPFLKGTRGDGDRSFDLAKSHGHVWLYLRK